MMKHVRRTISPMKTGVFKRVCLALVVLLLALALMVGAGSAAEVTYVAQIDDKQYESLDDAISAVETGTTETTIIEIIADGTYTISSIQSAKNITITGTKSAIINMHKSSKQQVSTGNSHITFDNVTVEFLNNNYVGFSDTKKIVYKNCVIKGTQFMYAPEVEFTNCVFEKYDAATEYNVWTYASNDGYNNVIFTGCTFNTGGKAILVYNEKAADSFVSTVTLTNCEFNSDDTIATDKAAVETGVVDVDSDKKAKNTETSNKYYITFNDCTVNGFAENTAGIPTGSKLWGNKNSMDDEHLIVVFVEMDKITLGDDKKYDGKTLTSPSEGVFTRHHVDKSTSTLETTYEWCEINGGEGAKNVGEYQLKASVTYANGHTVSAVKEGTVTISPATLTLTIAEGQSKAVGETEPTLTYSSTGHVLGETPKVNGQLTRVGGERAGTYLISFDTMTLDDNGAFLAKNYVLEQSTEPVYFTITPSVVIRGDNVPADHALTEEQVSQTDMDTFNTTIEVSYSDKFSAGKYFINVSLFDAQGDKADNSINFIIPYNALGISGDAGQYEFVVLHLLANGKIEEITAEAVPEGLKIGPTTTSPFAIGYTVKQSTPTTNGGSSSSSGSSVWLTETPTPTQTPTETPTDAVPTDIPVTQPTETPASPAFGALAAIAGLGAVAVLRRK